MSKKERKWFNPAFDFDKDVSPKKSKKTEFSKKSELTLPKSDVYYTKKCHVGGSTTLNNINHKNWMKNFDPAKVEDLAVHKKKVQEVEDWIKSVCNKNCNNILLLTGPVGCGKTITLQTLAAENNIKVTEWITPVDIEMPSEYGEYEYKEKQSTRFLEFIINAANFTSLLDNNNNKLVLVEDFPNTLIRTPSEFTNVLQQYKQRAKSPIVFICSESHADNKNTAVNLFTPNVKEQFNIHHITLNSVSATGLRVALKRASDIICKRYSTSYNIPTSDLIECVVNSSEGDVRSAILNLHFASLKGSNENLETSLIKKENKTKSTKKKMHSLNKFSSVGKDQTVSILHGVGRVLNPKVTEMENPKFLHAPIQVIEQFLSQPSSFINFLEENYLRHFLNIDHVENAASALSDSDFILAEWREKMCQEYGLYISIAGLMLSNKAPVSAWNPIRGPKSMKIQYPCTHEIPLLEQNELYKGKILVTDYYTYCKIIDGKT